MNLELSNKIIQSDWNLNQSEIITLLKVSLLYKENKAKSFHISQITGGENNSHYKKNAQKFKKQKIWRYSNI